MTHYSDAKWQGEPKRSLPICPDCDSIDVKELRRYPMDYTEMYVDYECLNCNRKFTINWS